MEETHAVDVRALQYRKQEKYPCRYNEKKKKKRKTGFENQKTNVSFWARLPSDRKLAVLTRAPSVSWSVIGSFLARFFQGMMMRRMGIFIGVEGRVINWALTLIATVVAVDGEFTRA